MNLDLQLIPTSTLKAMVEEGIKILEVRSESLPASNISILKHPYDKQWYFDITKGDKMVEAVNKKNAKNILECDERRVRSVLGYIQSRLGYDNKKSSLKQNSDHNLVKYYNANTIDNILYEIAKSLPVLEITLDTKLLIRSELLSSTNVKFDSTYYLLELCKYSKTLDKLLEMHDCKLVTDYVELVNKRIGVILDG